MKTILNIATLMVCLSFVFTITGCDRNARNNESLTDSIQITTDKDISDKDPTINNSQAIIDFVYPNNSDFEFNAEIENVNIKKGESFVIDCQLKNSTDNTYHIEHGIDIVTFNYNGESEMMESLALLDTFSGKEKKEERLKIKAVKSGIITVKAEIYVKPDKYSDSSKKYTYEKQFNVTVQDL